MGDLFSIQHLLLLLLIVVLIFGTKKLRNIGTDLGGGRSRGSRKAWRVPQPRKIPKKSVAWTRNRPLPLSRKHRLRTRPRLEDGVRCWTSVSVKLDWWGWWL